MINSKQAEELVTRYFERLNFASSKIISKHTFNDPKFFVKVLPDMIDTLVLQMYDFVWSEILDSAAVRYPSDWWQAFKERWFYKWMLDRWPVTYIEEVMEVKRFYPEWRDPEKGEFKTLVEVRRHYQ